MKKKIPSKKHFLLILLLFFTVNSFASPENSFDYREEMVPLSEVPLLLKGIWYNQNRYIVFDTGEKYTEFQVLREESKAFIPEIVLRPFYTWYDDYAAGSKAVTEKNNTVSRSPEILAIRFIPLVQQAVPENYGSYSDSADFFKTQSIPSGAWILQIKYKDDSNIYSIPAAVIGNNLYLKFKIRNLTEDEEPDSLSTFSGFWQDYGSFDEITINPPVQKSELLSYYVTENSVYHIRYWITKMDYDRDATAVFSDGEKSYSVKKHLRSGGKTYTCVNGKGNRIRNIEKSETPEDEYTLNSVEISTGEGTVNVSTICAIGKPYLTLTDGSSTLEEIIKEANSRHKPLPEPVFNSPHPDFHFEIIKDLNKYNRNLSIGKE